MSRDFDLSVEFLWHLITGAFMFLVAGAISAGLEISADYLAELPKLVTLSKVFHFVSLAILTLDVGCLMIFLFVRAWRFTVEAWKLKGE